MWCGKESDRGSHWERGRDRDKERWTGITGCLYVDSASCLLGANSHFLSGLTQFRDLTTQCLIHCHRCWCDEGGKTSLLSGVRTLYPLYQVSRGPLWLFPVWVFVLLRQRNQRDPTKRSCCFVCLFVCLNSLLLFLLLFLLGPTPLALHRRYRTENIMSSLQSKRS